MKKNCVGECSPVLQMIQMILVITAIMAQVFCVVSVCAGELKAGAAKVDIAAAGGVINDPPYVKALVLDDGKSADQIEGWQHGGCATRLRFASR
ncbi:MAG: hypothetical protein L3J39_12695 [Verrucomicrobiales bacterium]|nr:hypothetical protein [Verrucomicrobiales bacterium]